MKKIVLFSLMMACLPFLSVAQNANNDLYFIPKKKTEKKVTEGIPAKVVIETEKKAPTTVYASPGSTVVVKDVKGNVRDVDEYNRRYTSRDNTFSMENDTLYIEEKPVGERGEWVNGFEGSQSDYEYAMRIVRFRNPRYAIPVSSPLYWEVVYALPSWEWNVYDDGFYAYAFPTYSNSLWWDWRYSWGWSWRSPWYYSSFYAPGFWYGSYWGSWHHHHHYHPHWHHHHPHYGWAGVGGYWGGGHGWHGSSAHRPGIHAGRYENNYRAGYGSTQGSSGRRVASSSQRNSRDRYVNATRQNNTRTGNTVRTSSGRVVKAGEGNSASSVRPQRSAVRNNKETTNVRTNSVYTRPTQGRSSSYNRQSSTRSTVNNTGTSYQRRSGASQRGAYSTSSSGRSENRSSYSSGSSRSSSRSSYSSGSSRSSSRSSYSSGGGSSSRSSSSSGGGGGSRSSGGGGGSRSGGGGRR